MTNDDAGAQDDDDGEKEDELELMLLLGANERRLGRRSGPDNGWARDANWERPATLSRKLIPQLEHYLSLNGTGRHHLSTLVGRRCCGQTRSRE